MLKSLGIQFGKLEIDCLQNVCAPITKYLRGNVLHTYKVTLDILA